jgi:hypothetical protein
MVDLGRTRPPGTGAPHHAVHLGEASFTGLQGMETPHHLDPSSAIASPQPRHRSGRGESWRDRSLETTPVLWEKR